MTTVSYGVSRRYVGNRPWVDVVLNPISRSSSTLKCLADTGADYLQVNLADAVAAGLNVSSATTASTLTAGGSMTGLLMVTGVTVDIEGVRATVDVLVDPTNSTSPQIAGRQVLIQGLRAIGFDKAYWHH